MSIRMSRAALYGTAVLSLAGWAICASAGNNDKATIYVPDEIKWQEGVASLPPGAKVAVLEGDASKSGAYVYRLKMPDGYKIPPHKHRKTERFTVLSGKYHVGVGEKFDAKQTRALPPGSYVMWPAGTAHYAWSEGETVLQVHADGPWVVEYPNPADDPRKK